MDSERIFVTPRAKPLRVLVAKTKDEQRIGASEGFQDFDGMLFEYPYPSTASYWMKGTTIPLTIAWFDPSGRCIGFADMEPLSEEPVDAPGRYSFVLEVPQGSVDFSEGSQLRVNHVQRIFNERPEEDDDDDEDDDFERLLALDVENPNLERILTDLKTKGHFDDPEVDIEEDDSDGLLGDPGDMALRNEEL